MKFCLPSPARRFVSATLAALLLASSALVAGAPAIASAAPSGALSGAPPGASSCASPTVVSEIEASRTADSSTYQLSDGTRQADIYARPVHYRASDGSWDDIDPTLVPSGASGELRARSTQLAETFRAAEGTQAPVTVSNGHWELGMRLVGGEQAEPFTLGNEAVYPLAETGAQLTYESRRDGVKDTLVLSSADTPDTFTFFVSLRGLKLYTEPGGGGLAIYDEASGGRVGRMEPLSVYDSAKTHGADGVACNDASTTVTSVAGGAYVTYHVSRAWLDDPARVYPVYVDPSVTFAGPSDTTCDTYVSKSSSAYHYSENHLDASLFSSGDVRRSLLNFNLSGLPKGTKINSAVLQLYEWQNSSGGNASTYCEPVSGAWGNSATWCSTFGNGSIAIGSGGAIATIAGGANHYAYWDLSALTQRWVSGSLANNGVAVYSAAEGSVCQHSFWSSEYTAYTSRQPHLVVDYTPPSLTADPLPASVHAGDTVRVTLHATSANITNLQAKVDGILPSGAATTCVQFIFTSANPGGQWTSIPCDGGYLSYLTTPVMSGPTPAITVDPSEFETTRNDGGRDVTFAYHITAAHGDIQQNQLYIADTDFQQGWNASGNAYAMCTLPTTKPTVVASASAGWFDEASGSVAPPTAGRGSVTLSWPAEAAAAGYRVYMFDGNTYWPVVITNATSWSSAGKGVYPSDSAIAALPANYTGNPFSQGSCDLRDDPRPLYAATAGTQFDSMLGYRFKVVPYNRAGLCNVDACPPVTVALAGRTIHLSDEPRHTTADLGTVGFDDASVRVDRGDFDLHAVDLQIPGRGVDLTLDRTYCSANRSSGMSAPGWRFSFERSISATSGCAVYVDEAGDRHVFRKAGLAWVAPHGCTDVLTGDSSAGYTLAHKDRSAIRFDANGRLQAETDAFSNGVTYEWAGDGNSLVIRASGDIPVVHERRVTATFSQGRIVQAVAHVADGEADRIVTYSYPDGRFSIDREPGTSAKTSEIFGYDGSQRVVRVSVPGFVPSASGEAAWTVGYDATCSAVTLANDTGAGTPRMERTVRCDASAGLATIASSTGTSTLAFDPLGEQIGSSDENTSAQSTDRYDADGNTVAEKTAGGRTQSAVFDSRGNAVERTDELGATTSYSYQGDDCVREVTESGQVTARVIDPDTGSVLSEDRTLNDEGDTAHAENTYASDGMLTGTRQSVTETSVAQTDYSDESECGEPQTTTRRGVETAPGVTGDLVERSLYDGFGEQTQVVDATGAITRRALFDAAGREIEVTDATGTVTHTAYGALGLPVKQWRTNPATSTISDWTEWSYNGAGDPMFEVKKASNGTTVSVTAKSYDSAGREIKSDDSQVPGEQITRYDAQGNVAQTWPEGSDTDSPASSIRTSFTPDGDEASSTAPGATSASAVTSYTADGQVAASTEPGAPQVSYRYAADGSISGESVSTDAGQDTTRFTSDLDGRTIAETTSDGVRRTARYDLAGNEVQSDLDGSGATSSRTNVLGWPLVQTGSDGVATVDSYDADGRIVRESAGDQTTTWEYDGLGHVVRRTQPDASVITHTFDVFGNETASAETSGSSVLRTTSTCRDDAGRVSAESVSAADGALRTVRHHAYAADGTDTLTEQRPDGEVCTSTLDGTGRIGCFEARIGTTAVDWSVEATDAAGRTTRLASATLPMPRETWDQAGRPLSSSVASAASSCSYSADSALKLRDSLSFATPGRTEAWEYSYDLHGRLATATLDGRATAYAYDPATGDLLSRTSSGSALDFGYDSSGHLTSAGDRVFRSDSSGRRVSAGTTSTPNAQTFAWSGNRLVGITWPKGTARYSYDAQGQRLASAVTSGGITTTTRYDYDATRLDGLSAVRSDNTSWTLDYVYDDAGALLGGAYRSAARTTLFAAETNARGDVRELIDPSGAPFAFYGYDAYGMPTTAQSAGTTAVPAALAAQIASVQPLRYAGYSYDAESGCYYCSARYYDPSVSAFLSPDPARFDGDESPYQYCSGNPVTNVDPSGTEVWGYGEHGDDFYHQTPGVKGERALVTYCLSRIGGKYVYGAKAKPGREWSPGPLDCSGLTAAAYRVAHKADPQVFPLLPDGSQNQHDKTKSLGFRLSASKLRISDLGFLHDGGKDSGTVHHVGIYIGQSEVVEARGKEWGVVKTTLRAFNKRGADWHRGRKR